MKGSFISIKYTESFLAEKLVESLELDIDEKIQKAWLSEAQKGQNEI